jgi:hypothetical protein
LKPPLFLVSQGQAGQIGDTFDFFQGQFCHKIVSSSEMSEFQMG